MKQEGNGWWWWLMGCVFFFSPFTLPVWQYHAFDDFLCILVGLSEFLHHLGHPLSSLCLEKDDCFEKEKETKKCNQLIAFACFLLFVFPLAVFSSTQYGQVSMHASQFIPFVYVFSIWFSETLYVFSCFCGPSLDFLGWEWPTG